MKIPHIGDLVNIIINFKKIPLNLGDRHLSFSLNG